MPNLSKYKPRNSTTNEANTVVQRDASGNFTASSATKLATARTLSLSGAVTGSVSFDGTGDVAMTTTAIGGNGATGAGTDAVFFLNDQSVNTSYSIPSTKNAMTAGPITVAAGVTVTVPSGSVWTVV